MRLANRVRPVFKVKQARRVSSALLALLANKVLPVRRGLPALKGRQV